MQTDTTLNDDVTNETCSLRQDRFGTQTEGLYCNLHSKGRKDMKITRRLVYVYFTLTFVPNRLPIRLLWGKAPNLVCKIPCLEI